MTIDRTGLCKTFPSCAAGIVTPKLYVVSFMYTFNDDLD
uniref:Uncharacterized protein n=1 Tax=Arundo donax TaxID=35708 RepID=A0A0A9C3H0_ARUDO